jgi:hypothetical protein
MEYRIGDDFIFNATDLIVCNYVSYVMQEILSELLEAGYVKKVIRLPYDVLDKIDPHRTYPKIEVKGAYTIYTDVFVDLYIEFVCIPSYKDGIGLLCEAKLKIIPPIE